MAKKERSIEGALWKQDNEGNNRPLYKGTVTVKKDHVTNIDMSDADLKIWIAKVQKEGKFVLPEGLKLSMAFWNNKNDNPSSPALDGPVDNPYVKPVAVEETSVQDATEDAVEAFSRTLAVA